MTKFLETLKAWLTPMRAISALVVICGLVVFSSAVYNRPNPKKMPIPYGNGLALVVAGWALWRTSKPQV